MMQQQLHLNIFALAIAKEASQHDAVMCSSLSVKLKLKLTG